MDKLGTILPLITDFKLLMLTDLPSAVVTRYIILNHWKDWRWGVGNKISFAHQMENTWNLPLLYGVWLPEWQTAFLQGSFAIKLSLIWTQTQGRVLGSRRNTIPFSLVPQARHSAINKTSTFTCAAEKRNRQSSRASYTAVPECKRKKSDTQ